VSHHPPGGNGCGQGSVTRAFLSEMNVPLCTWLDSIPEEENTKLAAYKTNEILHILLSLFSLRRKGYNYISRDFFIQYSTI